MNIIMDIVLILMLLVFFMWVCVIAPLIMLSMCREELVALFDMLKNRRKRREKSDE